MSSKRRGLDHKPKRALSALGCEREWTVGHVTELSTNPKQLSLSPSPLLLTGSETTGYEMKLHFPRDSAEQKFSAQQALPLKHPCIFCPLPSHSPEASVLGKQENKQKHECGLSYVAVERSSFGYPSPFSQLCLLQWCNVHPWNMWVRWGKKQTQATRHITTLLS